jgi:hypothetical protein
MRPYVVAVSMKIVFYNFIISTIEHFFIAQILSVDFQKFPAYDFSQTVPSTVHSELSSLTVPLENLLQAKYPPSLH